uniref:Uncharacterized protein LOC114329201 n=1 Tax=Diabrotica virgifera virgifera TaxID=50390 RepID=A0A6P7FGK9_DIAVI
MIETHAFHNNMLDKEVAARKRKVAELARVIRKKYLALKLGRTEQDETLNKLFEPLAKPLKDIAQSSKTSHHAPNNKLRHVKKEEVKTEEAKKEDSDDDVFSDAISTYQDHENEDLKQYKELNNTEVHHNSIGNLKGATAEKYLNIVKPLFKPKKAKKQSPKIKSTRLKKLSLEGQEKATRSPPKTRSTTSKKSPLEVVKATRSSSSATSSTSKGSGFIDASHLIYNDNPIESRKSNSFIIVSIYLQRIRARRCFSFDLQR